MASEHYKSQGCTFIFLTRGQGDGKEVLLQKRQNTGYADGLYYASASGHLEEGESLWECAARETNEEIGLDLSPKELKFALLNHEQHENYIRAVFIAELPEGMAPINCEPDKCSEITWFKLNQLPSNVAPHIPKILECIKLGIYYDDGDFTNLARKV